MSRCLQRERGFTLLELVIAMTVMALMSVAIYGVISMGARAAGSGERRTEQARRLRLATDLMVRQLRSAAPLSLVTDEELRKFFFGESDYVTFVTAAPQLLGSSGLSLVEYSFDDGRLLTAEIPLFAVLDTEDIDFANDPLAVTTTLLYDVKTVTFSYRRLSHRTESWEESWDAEEEDELPASVFIEVEPSTQGGPSWFHQVPLFVGVFNEITAEDDFRQRGLAERSADQRSTDDEDDEEDDDDFDDDDEEDDE